MLETALSGVHHGDIGFVAGFDGLIVIGGPARLNHRCDAVLLGFIDAVRQLERDVGIPEHLESLEADDINAIRFLYPATNPNPPPDMCGVTCNPAAWTRRATFMVRIMPPK